VQHAIRRPIWQQLHHSRLALNRIWDGFHGNEADSGEHPCRLTSPVFPGQIREDELLLGRSTVRFIMATAVHYRCGCDVSVVDLLLHEAGMLIGHAHPCRIAEMIMCVRTGRDGAVQTCEVVVCCLGTTAQCSLNP
jgi:hypothetical protein